MSVGDTRFSFSPSGRPNKDDLNESRKLMRADFKLVTGVDVPYCAGYNEAGDTIYIDKDVPETAVISGRTLSIWEHVMDHEMIEKAMLEKFGNEKYQGAHTVAEFWEDLCVRSNGYDPNAYEEWWNGIIATIAARPEYKRVPADLDLTPYRDEQDTKTLDKMTFFYTQKEAKK